jgi:predicted RNA-binding Zn-ribbon protein involved in translation (DUF1610 family)
MADYINREAVRNELYDADAITMKGVAILNNFQSADVVEVKHGEWIVCGDGEYVPFMCSACGKTTSWYHKQTANYCPNCGAKMDGERKDNE